MKWLALLAILAVGCNQQDQDNVTKDASNLAHSAGKAIENASIGSKINMVLSWEKDLDISKLKIDAQDNSVTFTGTVPSEEQHQKVVSLTKGLKGVDKVEDNIKVEPASSPSPS